MKRQFILSWEYTTSSQKNTFLCEFKIMYPVLNSCRIICLILHIYPSEIWRILQLDHSIYSSSGNYAILEMDRERGTLSRPSFSHTNNVFSFKSYNFYRQSKFWTLACGVKQNSGIPFNWRWYMCSIEEHQIFFIWQNLFDHKREKILSLSGEVSIDAFCVV